MDLGLQGKAALVTGGSRGIGFAIAAELAAEGADVAICARDRKVLEAARKKLASGSKGKVAAFPADVSREREVNRLVTDCVERLGRLDILVTNAGGPPATTFSDTPADAWQEAIDLNLMSAVRLCQAAVPEMRKRGWGRIVMITSIAVKQPIPELILSNTARTGLTGFAKTLATELAPEGILVNTVCPGYTGTERLQDLAREMSRREGISEKEVIARWTQGIPLGRLGDPSELASLVAFLASERAGYITGTTIQVDGGFCKGLF
jgi:3-oxoacyl-[acyl-carrier protein] reductase